MKPARCCVLTQRGTRCANEPSPVRPVRMIGPVRLAACGLEAHQRALWSLPGFVRHDAYCGAFGCDRPSNAGICQKHRDQYRDFGITEHMLLAQEAPMTEPTPPPSKLPELGFPRVQIQASSASLADLEAAATGMTIPTPPAAPQGAADGGATPDDPCLWDEARWALCYSRDSGFAPALWFSVAKEEQEVYMRVVMERMAKSATPSPEAPKPAPADDGEPSEGDVDDALDSYPGGFATSPPAFGPTPAPADAQPTDPMQQRREAVVARLLALGFKEHEGTDTTRMFLGHGWSVPIPLPGHDESVRKADHMLDDAERLCRRMEIGAGAAPTELMARWGYKQDVPLDGLAALAARGQEPTAPSPTVAELQAELQAELKEMARLSECRRKEVQRRGDALARVEKLLEEAEADAERERKRANEADGLRIHAETDLIRERERADAAQHQLREALADLATIAVMLDPEDSPAYDSDGQPIPLPTRVQAALGVQESNQIRHMRAEMDALWGIIDDAEWIVHACGSYGAYGATNTLADRILRLLPTERQRAILELQRSVAHVEVARSQARFLNPPPPERAAELVAKVAALDARIAALDAG